MPVASAFSLTGPLCPGSAQDARITDAELQKVVDERSRKVRPKQTARPSLPMLFFSVLVVALVFADWLTAAEPAGASAYVVGLLEHRVA